MMDRWLYYTRIAIQDLLRLWPATQHHVIIVAGICLPIMLLLGLKQGHVAQLRHELLTSPTGRQIVFWSAQQGDLINRKGIGGLESTLPGVELIIPDTQRPVRLCKAGGKPRSVTLYSTKRGDPVLRQVHADLLNQGEKGLVLSQTAARELEVQPGDELTLSVERQMGSISDQAETMVVLRAVIPANAEKAPFGFGDIELLDKLEQFVRGYQVSDFGWPALKVPVRDRYKSYLLFCEAANNLTVDDHKTLIERGLRIEELDPESDPHLRLFLRPGRHATLRAYRIQGNGADPARWLSLAPSEISEWTTADDVVLPWNDPLAISTPMGRPWLVGLSLPVRSWLREYLRDPRLAFDYEAETWTTVAGGDGSRPPVTVRLTTGLELAFNGKPHAADKSATSAPLTQPTTGIPQPKILPQGSPATGKTPSIADKSTATTGRSGPMVTAAAARPPSADKPLSPSPSAIATPPSSPEKKASPVTQPSPIEGGISPKQGAAASRASGSVKNAEKLDSGKTRTNQQAPLIPTKSSEANPRKPLASAPSPTALFVPVQTLAYCHAYLAGSASYDAKLRMFVPMPESPLYSKARLFTRTIDDVPTVAAALLERKYAIMSETARITEIQQQASSLQLLVYVVGLGVFVFGVVTVVSVLQDSTDRKRGAIGVLRVMGVSRSGVFYLVALRAAVIGLLAGAASIAVGYGIALILTWPVPDQWRLHAWKPVVAVCITPGDAMLVFSGALACSGLGSVLPAWRASRMDPFEAIIEGRFR